MNPPPPPPPHGNPGSNRNGLPDGHYDIFVIPPHSSGGGFLYLPSLQPHRNSFLAGVVCSLLAILFWVAVIPVLKEWTQAIMAGGGFSVVILCIAVGVACWAFGKTQAETSMPSGGSAGGGSGAYTAGNTSGGPTSGGPTPQPQPQYAPPPEPRAPPKPSWQRSNTGPANGTANAGAAKSAWEKAREETRKKEEEKKRAEDILKRREEAAKEREKQREKDARERQARERREKEVRERLEKETREKLEKEARERREKERSRPASPTKEHRHPTAKTATDDDAYSFRPYDNPKRPAHKTASASSIYSESSYAPSQSTSRTTPPPSHRGPYRSKDPDKIILKAVYAFNDIFTKKPIAQLVSGSGPVTDGLILRITSAGLFIDDDVRDVPQREWDIKTWTLKLIEVWCPHLHALGASSGSIPASRNANPGPPGIFGKRSASKQPTEEETWAFLNAYARACKSYPSGVSGTSSPLRTRSDLGNSPQTGEHKGLHVLRATIRDADNKRYVFILSAEEGWKVAVGLQRLRKGTQARALGVSGMAINEMKAVLENMGHA